MAVSRQDAKAYSMHSFSSACKSISTAVKEQICFCQSKSSKGSDRLLCRSSCTGRHLSLVVCFFAETVRSRNVTEVPSHVPINMLGLPSVTLGRCFGACFVKWRHLPGWGQGGTRSRCHGPGCQVPSSTSSSHYYFGILLGPRWLFLDRMPKPI